MKILAGIAGLALMLLVLLDAFETIVLPRRVSRRVRLARLFYRSTWRPWRAVSRLLRSTKRKEGFLSYFGPLSLLLLLTVWAAGLVIGFTLLHWAAGSAVVTAEGRGGFTTDLYFSGSTLFTLGLGDVEPRSALARVLVVVEAGLGFGFLAMVISYLPVIYQAFSRREVNISLLDARAGSPPTSAELLRGYSRDQGMEALQELLRDWERWSAELLESHLSYPVLAYFRSQHTNQSWLAALTAILDTSALVIAGLEGPCRRQAKLTFAMARHAVVDLAQVFSTPPSKAVEERLPADELSRLQNHLAAAGLPFRRDGAIESKLSHLRHMYEPYVQALSRYLELKLPQWMPEPHRRDNWQTSAWEPSSAPAEGDASVEGEHF